MKYYFGFRKGLLVIFLMKKLILSYTDWSLDIKCTNAVHIANGNVNVAVLSLPHADLVPSPGV